MKEIKQEHTKKTGFYYQNESIQLASIGIF